MEIKSVTLQNTPFPTQALLSVQRTVLLYLFSNYILNELNGPRGIMGEIHFLAITAYVLFRDSEHFHCLFIWSLKVQSRNLKAQKMLFRLQRGTLR